MKNLRFPRTVTLVLSLQLAMVALTPVIAQQNDQAEVMLRAAKNKQLVDGDLDQAIQMYKTILSQYSENRPVAAKALVEMGDCYEKLGKSEALKAYQRVLRDYSDQSAEANEARARLAALAGGGSAKSTEMVTRRLWAGPEVDTEGAVTPDGRFLTYTDWRTGDIAIRNLLTGASRRITHNGTPDLDQFAQQSVPSPDGRQIAYAWLNKDDFYELRTVPIDTAEPRTIYRNPAVEYLEPRAWTPDGKEILASFFPKDGGVQIVAVSSSSGSVRVLKEFKEGDGMSPDLSISSDGRYIAYDYRQPGGSGGRDIAILPIDGGPETGLVHHPADDRLLAFAPDGKSVIFASDRTGSYGAWAIDVVDGKPHGSPRLIKPDIGSVEPMGSAANGSFYYGNHTQLRDVYTASMDFASGNLLKSPTLVTQLSTGHNMSPDWSPDGKYLAYLSARHHHPVEQGSRTDTIVIGSLESGQERELAPAMMAMNATFGLRWSADGRSFFVDGHDDKGQSGLFRINSQTGAVSLVVKDGPDGFVGFFAPTPDGKSLIYRYATKKNTTLVFRNLESGKERVLFESGANIFVPAVSPDGSQVAFYTLDDPRVLRVMPVAGGEAHELVSLKKPESFQGFGGAIAWTPDGRYIVFGRTRSGTFPAKTELWEVRVEDGQPQKLPLSMDLTMSVRVHPEGKEIAFEDVSRSGEIWVMQNLLPTLKASR